MRHTTSATEMTTDQEASYVAGGGFKCPFCGCENIEGGSIEIDTGSAYQDVSCTECEKEWTDTYRLVGVI